MTQEQIDEVIALAKSLPELVQKLTDKIDALGEGTQTPVDGFSKKDLDTAVAALEALVPADAEPIV